MAYILIVKQLFFLHFSEFFQLRKIFKNQAYIGAEMPYFDTCVGE